MHCGIFLAGHRLNPSSSRSSSAALFFILLTVFIDSVGFGIIIPVLPTLITDLTGADMSGAARWGGWLALVFALLQFFTAPVIGNLSDQYGRRPLLLGSLLAFSIDFLVCGFAPTILWLFIGRAMAGIFAATFSTAAAYVGDISEDDNRTHNFALIGAAWGVGFIVGPVIGGFAGEFGPRVPFFVASGLALGNCVFGYFVLPESLPQGKRRAFQWSRANPLGALRSLSHFPKLAGLLLAMFFFRVAHDAMPSVWTFFVIEQFGWGEREIGYSLGFVGLMSALVMAVLVRRLVPLLGDRRAVLGGFTLATLGFVLIAAAQSGVALYAGLLVFALGGIANPTLQSHMSHMVGPTQQGELQGAIASLMSISMIIAPLFMTQLFGYFTGPTAPVHFPGAAYVAAAVLTAVSVALAARVLRPSAAG
jgi:MFS transporter, DHA1 family, tetracycline resistance protein